MVEVEVDGIGEVRIEQRQGCAWEYELYCGEGHIGWATLLRAGWHVYGLHDFNEHQQSQIVDAILGDHKWQRALSEYKSRRIRKIPEEIEDRLAEIKDACTELATLQAETRF